MKSFFDATKVVEKHLNDEGSEGFEICLVKTLPVNVGWVFYYQSKEWMETRNPLDGLAGNAPIIFDRINGTLHTRPKARRVLY